MLHRGLKKFFSAKLVVLFVIFAGTTFAGNNHTPYILTNTNNVSYASSQASRTNPGDYLFNTPLLSAPSSRNPSFSRGGGDITTVGGVALISETGPSGSFEGANRDTSNPGKISVYIVREADTLSQIAEMFGVTSNTIRWANDIGEGDTISPGDELVILPVTGIRHIVQDGDTLEDIVEEYNGEIEEVASFNALSIDSDLTPGDVITIPDGEVTETVHHHASDSADDSSGTAVAVSPPQSSSGPVISGYFMRPVAGGVRSQGIHGYNAIDIAAPSGTPILASAAGEVIIVRNSGWNGGYGNYVVIRHGNGTQTLYAHNSSNTVSVGQSVVQGQVIGYIGATGKTTGYHVHFEVRGATNPF